MNLKSSETVKISTGSRQSRLRKVTFFDSDSTFAVSADSVPPSIQLFKAIIMQLAQTKSPIATLRPTEEAAVMGMTGIGEENLLAYVTQAGILHIHDNREQKDVLKCEFGCQRGLPLCLSPGIEGKSLLIGTASAYVLLYDLRFNIVGWSLRYSKQTPVLGLVSFRPDKRCCFHTNLQSSTLTDPYVLLATGGDSLEIPLLNLRTGRCGVLFTGNNPSPVVPYLLNEDGSLPTPIPRPPLFQQFMREARLPSNEVYQRHLLERIGEVTRKNKELLQAATAASQRIRSVFESRNTVRSILCPSFKSVSVPYMVTAGAEAVIRFWDFQTPKNSHRVLPNLAPHSMSYAMHQLSDVCLVEESETGDPLPAPMTGPMRSDLGEFTPEWKVKHLDDILDLALAYGSGGGVLISAGRDGSIRLWN